MNKPAGSGQTENQVDIITREVVWHSLRAIASELETNMTRTAFSPLIYEYKDYTVGLLAADGDLICQGFGGLPVFLADIGGPLKHALKVLPPAEMSRGDIIITNNPVSCGQHLNNVNMYTPIFAGDEVVAFTAVRAHWHDVGGQRPGGFSNSTTEIFQEGYILPDLKLAIAGKISQDMMRIILSNTRTPDITLGDLQAQIAACRLGERRFADILTRYGWPVIKTVVRDVNMNSERLARERVKVLPDGEYVAESFLDDDGVDLGKSIPIKVKVIIRGDELTVDMTEIADEVRGPFNSGYAGGGLTAAKVAFRYGVIPDLPTNEGCFRPLSLVLPPGKFLSAKPTAAMARWNMPMSTVIDTILKALSQAAPEKIPAGHHAAQNSYDLFGLDDGTGNIWRHHDTGHGGWGAWPDADGPGPFKTLSHGDTFDIPAEIVEALYPLRVEEYRWRPDSAGPGKYRGGLGTVKVYRLLADTELTINFERTQCPPWGLFGGQAAQVGRVRVQRPVGQVVEVPNKAVGYVVEAGGRITLEMAGGGGYGPARERAVDRVVEDVRQGYVSRESAERDYGVAFQGDSFEANRKKRAGSSDRR